MFKTHRVPCCAGLWILKASGGGGGGTALTLNDTFCGGICLRARMWIPASSLRGDIRMRVATDRGRFFSGSLPSAFWSPCEDKQETGAGAQYLFLTVSSCREPYFVSIGNTLLNTDSLTANVTSWKTPTPAFQAWSRERFTLLRAAGTVMWLPLMWQYLAHMASVPPDPQHNHCIGFPSWCPLCIHGSPNASIRFLVNGFIYMEKCPPPPGVWTSRLESLPALPFALSCMWMEALVDCDLTSLFVRSHSLVGWIWPWDSSPS